MSLGGVLNWISGDDPNKEARASERDARKAGKKQARAEYSYAKDLQKAEKKDYFANREFAYNTAVTNWEYGKKIQDYQYAQSLAVYEKSQDIYKGQTGYNQQAESIAVSDQEASIQDLVLSQAFQREAMHSDLENQIQAERSKLLNTEKTAAFNVMSAEKAADFNVMSTVKNEGFKVMSEIKSAGIGKLEQGAKLYGIKSGRRIGTESVQQALNKVTKQNTFEKEAKFVESLQKSGKAALGQAGVSRAKSLQSTAAESFRDLVALDSSLSGSRNRAAVDLLKLQVDASIAETQVGLNLDRIRLGVTTAQERSRLTINQAQDQAALSIHNAHVQAALRVNEAQDQAALRINAAQDEVKYNNKILDANMQSATSQMTRNIDQIALQKQNADLQAQANLNLFPEEFDYAPEPQMTPERTFVKPIMREVYIPKGPRTDTGFTSVAPGLLQIASMAVGAVKPISNLFASAPKIGETVLSAGVPLSTGSNATNVLNNFLNPK